jgi:hypothetical protein
MPPSALWFNKQNSQCVSVLKASWANCSCKLCNAATAISKTLSSIGSCLKRSQRVNVNLVVTKTTYFE